jgi:hypothetical protein
MSSKSIKYEQFGDEYISTITWKETPISTGTSTCATSVSGTTMMDLSVETGALASEIIVLGRWSWRKKKLPRRQLREGEWNYWGRGVMERRTGETKKAEEKEEAIDLEGKIGDEKRSKESDSPPSLLKGRWIRWKLKISLQRWISASF